MNHPSYGGSELELFAEARNWKAYLATCIRPFLGEVVLEVGAGMGGSTAVLASGTHEKWTCVEPDARLADQLQDKIRTGALPDFCEAFQGTLADMPESNRYDSALYIDVLEHIEDDLQEVQSCVSFLRPRGHLIAVCPAHMFLFSPFDAAIGHFRRYNKQGFRRLSGEKLELLRLWYLDSVGLFASMANSCLLRQRYPTRRQIDFWDGTMVPLSRWIDPLLAHGLGKSILGVWRVKE